MNWFAKMLLGALVLVLPLAAPAITTPPVSVVPTVEQTVLIYDAVSVRAVTDNALTGSIQASTPPVQFFGRVAGLVAAESGIPAGITYEGTVFRSVNPNYASSSWNVTAQNIASDHRYSSVGRGAVYASTSESALLAEMQHYGIDMATRSVLKRQVSVGNILDLTSPAVRQQLGVLLEQINGDSYFTTHALGDFARGRYNGILAPSARKAGTSNLILFGGL